MKVNSDNVNLCLLYNEISRFYNQFSDTFNCWFNVENSEKIKDSALWAWLYKSDIYLEEHL